jgi:hypothetical protein
MPNDACKIAHNSCDAVSNLIESGAKEKYDNKDEGQWIIFR